MDSTPSRKVRGMNTSAPCCEVCGMRFRAFPRVDLATLKRRHVDNGYCARYAADANYTRAMVLAGDEYYRDGGR